MAIHAPDGPYRRGRQAFEAFLLIGDAAVTSAEASSLCISDVVLYELLFRAEKSARPIENRTFVERFAARLSVLPFDSAAAAHTAEIRATLEQRGTPIGAYDVMIAGHARSRGLIVVTGNRREFERVDGLRSEDWL